MFYGAWLVLILAGFALAGAEIWQEVEKYRYEKEEEAAKPEIMLIQVKNDEYYRRLLNDRSKHCWSSRWSFSPLDFRCRPTAEQGDGERHGNHFIRRSVRIDH